MHRGKVFSVLLAALVLQGAALYACAQSKVTARPSEKKPEAETKEAAKETDAARYFYEFTQPDFAVYHIVIEHDSTGRGQVLFERRSDSEPLTEPFRFSDAAWQRVSALWTALNFLDSTTNYQSPKPIPSIGTTRLRLKRGTRERTVEFNYTSDRDAFALANEYRRAADQVLFVFEIEVARENQPLDSPKLLSRLEAIIQRNGLSDPQQLLPLLRELTTDERLPLIARNHATRLLKRLEK